MPSKIKHSPAKHASAKTKHLHHARSSRTLTTNPKQDRKGLTMIELLVVAVIIGSATTVGVQTMSVSQDRARDAERKSDLQTIKTAFEDYYNDNNCYPPPAALDNCASADLSPYLPQIPCDPKTKEPYVYQPLENRCQGYRLLTSLRDDSDDDIAALHCDDSCGCGFGPTYNYGVSSGVTVKQDECTPLPDSSPVPSAPTSPSPTGSSSPAPSSGGTVYACDSGGTCNVWSEVQGDCFTFDDPQVCNIECAANAEVYACEGGN